MTKNIVKTHFNNLIKQPNFPGLPEPPGLPQQEPPRTIRTRYEGKGPVPAVCLATVTVMAARKEQGGQQAQEQGREFQHGEGSSIFYCSVLRLSSSQAVRRGHPAAYGQDPASPSPRCRAAGPARYAGPHFRCAGGKAPQPGGVPAAPGSGTMHEGLFVSSPDWGRSASKNN